MVRKRHLRQVGSIVLGLGLLAGARSASAQIAVASTSTSLTFDDFTGAGFQPTPDAGELDSDSWAVSGASDGDLVFGGAATTGDLARGASNGDETQGGIYAYGSGGGNVLLGVRASTADFTPGAVTARFVNALGQSLLNFDVSYRIWVYANGERATLVRFAYSTDNVTFTDVPAVDYTTFEPIPTTPEWRSYDQMTTLALDVPDGELFYLRWTFDDASGSAQRDELGLDDISLTVLPGCGNGVTDGSEECDDGNDDNDDACRNDCTEPPTGSGGEGGSAGETSTGGQSGESTGGSSPAAGSTSRGGRAATSGGRPAMADAGEGTDAGAGTGGTGSAGKPSGGGPASSGGKGGSGSGGVSSGGKKSTAPESKDSGGCGCEIPGRTRQSGLPFFLGLALVAAIIRRRRAR